MPENKQEPASADAGTSTRPGTAPSIRARVRAEMTDQIKAVALRHLATDGTALSLRAVARDMGMVSSALYRYFASRDELLTALIIDAYDSLGAAVEAADARHDRSDLFGRWLSWGTSARNWALASPHEYALIYGSPIPGYKAPETTIDPAGRPVVVLANLLADAHAAGLRTGTIAESAGPGGVSPGTAALLDADVARIDEVLRTDVGAQAMARALAAYTQIYGAISFEIFGRLTNVFSDYGAWFDWQLRSMAAYLGLEEKA